MKLNRRKFFGLVGTGTVATAISQLIPFKLLAFGNQTQSTSDGKIKVKIHPLAVPRNNGSKKVDGKF